MANQNYRIFPNKVTLFNFFGAYIPELNVSVSCRVPLNGFAIGKEHRAFRTFPEFFKALADLSGLPVDTKNSTLRVGNYIVFFDGEILPPTAVTRKVVPKVEEAVVVKEEILEDNVEVKEETQAVDVSVIVAEAKSLLDEADKKGSKDKLAEFAANKGVTLSKSKTFENMLADFESALK